MLPSRGALVRPNIEWRIIAPVGAPRTWVGMDQAAWSIHCIVGTRPNFVKIAPIMRSLRARDDVRTRLIHTGQHYDVAMNATFFDELAIPQPDINLEIGSGTNSEQTARIMLGIEPELIAHRPDILLVVGDVNSTMATALVAAKLLIPIVHVEAGLRSNDLSMPEEINRLVTDRLSALLLTTERAAVDNLLREGVAPKRIRFVGNVMIDTLYASLERAHPVENTLAETNAAAQFREAAKEGLGFVTLHRPSNVDDPEQLGKLLEALVDVSRDVCLLFAAHPRTRAAVVSAGLEPLLARGRIHVTPPLSYLRSLGILRQAPIVLTDSGGVQEETTALGVPCLTIRDNTERPITVDEGTNTLIGSSPSVLRGAVEEVLKTGGKRGRVPELWDGKAAQRVAAETVAFLEATR
jgi:UDP-N-acetylglucosamine 2-epimerase (non-hydrolysing)